MATFKEHANPVYSVAFSYDGKFVVSASPDNTICVWSTETAWKSLYIGDSIVDSHEWVKGKGGELLFWTPPRHHMCFHRPNNIRIISTLEMHDGEKIGLNVTLLSIMGFLNANA